MAACNLIELPEANCYLCLSDKQLAAVTIALLCQILQQLNPMAHCNVADLLADGHPYLALNNREMGAVMVHLLCSIANTASLGPSGVNIDTVDPVADPGIDSQIWINRTTGGVWYWNDTTGSWIALIV